MDKACKKRKQKKKVFLEGSSSIMQQFKTGATATRLKNQFSLFICDLLATVGWLSIRLLCTRPWVQMPAGPTLYNNYYYTFKGVQYLAWIKAKQTTFSVHHSFPFSFFFPIYFVPCWGQPQKQDLWKFLSIWTKKLLKFNLISTNLRACFWSLHDTK